MRRNHRNVISNAAFMAGIALCTTGCEHLNSALLTKHWSNDRKQDAQEHWDTVRGEVKLQLARQHLAAGRLAECEKVLHQAASIAPKDPQAYMLMTRLRLEQGRLADARQAVSAAAALPTNDPEVPYLAGIVAQRYGDLEAAAEYYAAAARKAPTVEGYLLAEAETLVTLDRTTEALERIESRLKDFDTSAPLRMLAARVCRSLGLRGPAAAYCREAVRICSEEAGQTIEAAGILAWAERYDEAISLLSPLVEPTTRTGPWKQSPVEPGPHLAQNPITPSVRRMLATAYFASDRPRDALRVLEMDLNVAQPPSAVSREDTSSDSATCCLYARAALAVGEFQAAAGAIEMAHRTSTPTPESLLLSAQISWGRGDYRAALDSAGRALGMNEKLVAAWCVKGRSAAALGRRDEAENCYRLALALDNTSVIVMDLLASLDAPLRCKAAVGETPLEDFTPSRESTWRVQH